MELGLLAALAGLGYVASQVSSPQARVPEVPEAVNQQYADEPAAPDILPRVVPYYHMPDVDERNPHNYPGPPRDAPHLEDLGAGTSLSQAFDSNRGYANRPGDSWGPGDVTNTLFPQGIFPLIGRTAETPLYIESLPPEYFKPPKSTVLQDDLRQEPMPQPDVFGSKSIVGFSRNYIDPYTRFRGPRGQLDNLYPGAVAGGDCNASYGFSNGEKFTLRTGGFHQRRRPFRMEESKRKQLYFSIRNPNFAVGRSGSIYAQGRGELGHLELPYNAYVKEWYREPVPNAGLTTNRKRADPQVVLQCTSRDKQLFGWAGPRGTGGRGQESLRLLTTAELTSRQCQPTYGKEVDPGLQMQFNQPLQTAYN